MKITNQNVGYWIWFTILLLLWFIPDWTNMHESESADIKDCAEFMKAIAAFFGLITIAAILCVFVDKCRENKIVFEVDLLALFRRRSISPEEQDKQNK